MDWIVTRIMFSCCRDRLNPASSVQRAFSFVRFFVTDLSKVFSANTSPVSPFFHNNTLPVQQKKLYMLLI